MPNSSASLPIHLLHALISWCIGVGLTLADSGMAQPWSSNEAVARSVSGRLITPVNQVVTSAGRLLDLPGSRPQALALSPDGMILVTAGKTHELIVVDPVEGRILQHVPLPGEKDNAAAPETVSDHILRPDKEGQVSFTGLVFSPDGSRIYMANVNGSIKVFSVSKSHSVTPQASFVLPQANAPGREQEIPAGLAISADGKRLYIALNLSNRLAEMDTATGRVLRTWDVGVAPYDVVLAAGKVYVSNWGGRRPGATDLTGPAGRGMRVRVDPVRHIASEGSVSVIDLALNRALAEILTGLHAWAWLSHPMDAISWPPMRAVTRYRSSTPAPTPSWRPSGPGKTLATFSAPAPTRWPLTLRENAFCV